MLLSVLILILIVNLCTGIFLFYIFRTFNAQEKKHQRQIEELLQHPNIKKIGTEQLRDEWRSYVFIQALQVREAISKQVSNLHPKLIEEAPSSHGLSNKELSEAFTPEQIEAITFYWDLYRQYADTYWKTDQGKVKTVFKGSVDLKGSEVHRIQTASNQILPKIDQLLIKIKGVEH
ncbi:hypothetical protein [Alkalihalobacterium sp. APHAB7]|uniref:hypothetical protein n=1 Tax=Alkalihalobacterium sp. APHAB7 TaxID=3402081 RepID=UPI003AAEBC29